MNDITGAGLYEQYENGADIDSLNENIATETAEPSAEENSSTETNQEPNTDDSQTQGNPSEPNTAEEEPPFRVFATADDFQKTIDKAIGARIYSQKKTNEQFKADVAAYLGIPSDGIDDFIKNAKYQREAETAGYSDPELYAKNKQLEEAFTTQRQEFEHNQFMASIEMQVNALSSKYQGFNMDNYVDDPVFCQAVKAFYDNPHTRNNAVELAFRGVRFEDASKTIAKMEQDKLIATIKAGKQLPDEGAAKGSNSQIKQINPAKMTEAQYDELLKRIMDGEKVYLE